MALLTGRRSFFVTRREFVLVAASALGCARAGRDARAQERPRRIGFLSLRSQPNEYDAAFREALTGLGHIEGRTVQIDYQWAAESEQRAEALAALLVQRKVDIIVAATTAAIRAAMRATGEIPIVMAAAADPVGSGLVASLARPGGNVTGLTLTAPDTAMKRLQLLKELVPHATRVAVLLAERGALDDVSGNVRLVEQLELAAGRLGLTLTIVTLRNADDLSGSVLSERLGHAHAMIVQASSLTIDNRDRIAELAARHAIPAMYETEAFVRAGGLMSYGPSIAAMYRRAASYVDKILKGASPADLPVEQPSEFRLLVAVKAAEALGLSISPTILARADEVIE
jgi:putative ABC transport system substrate-binding protein